MVKGVLVRLKTYLHWMLFVLLSLTEGAVGAKMVGAGSVVEGAIVAVLVSAVLLVLELEWLDWGRVSAERILVGVVKNSTVVMSCKVIQTSTFSFEIKCSNLLICLALILLCLCSLILFMRCMHM